MSSSGVRPATASRPSQETLMCLPFLRRAIEICRPRVPRLPRRHADAAPSGNDRGHIQAEGQMASISTASRCWRRCIRPISCASRPRSGSPGAISCPSGEGERDDGSERGHGRAFIPVRIAVMTVSDTRGLAEKIRGHARGADRRGRPQARRARHRQGRGRGHPPQSEHG